VEEAAQKAHDARAFDEAERLAIDPLQLAPGRSQPFYILYEIRWAQRKYRAAMALVGTVLTEIDWVPTAAS
jgi:hypothetical protein